MAYHVRTFMEFRPQFAPFPLTTLVVFGVAFAACLGTLEAGPEGSGQKLVVEAEELSVRSPSGELELRLRLRNPDDSDSARGVLHYEVAFRGQDVIEASAMGLELAEKPGFDSHLRILSSQESSGEEAYSLLHGKTNQARDSWNGLEAKFASSENESMTLGLDVRVFNDAVAFRYRLSGHNEEARIRGERTTFRFPGDAMTLAMQLPSFESMYESEYTQLPLSAFANQGGVNGRALLGLPAVLELPGLAWLAVTEADLRGTSSLYLRGSENGWVSRELVAALAPRIGEPDVAVLATLPWHSAWRVILIGDSPGRLIESTVITSLNPAVAISDVSWIRPGKAAWNWWSGSLGDPAKGKGEEKDFSTDGIQYYVDFAAEMGLEYVLIDAGWSPFDDITRVKGPVDVPAVLRYAKERAVGVWLWAHYDAVERQMEKALAVFESWGVAGIKIDFISRDDQVGMEFYYRVAETAARHRLMVDLHGSTKPSGMERTWPNVLGYEAVLGMEQSKAGARDNPDHRVTLPFTRMLLGQMDYTPGGFRNVTREAFEPRMTAPLVMGTRAHHMAMYVVFDAPFQMVSDHPAAYRGEAGLSFVAQVPVRWDETRFLSGSPGEFVVLARRHGRDWYLGAMAGWSGKEVEVDLSFLGQGRYQVQLFEDTPASLSDPAKVRESIVELSGDSDLLLHLVGGGGAAAHFSPDD